MYFGCIYLYFLSLINNRLMASDSTAEHINWGGGTQPFKARYRETDVEASQCDAFSV